MNNTDTIATSAKYGEGDRAIYARAERSCAVYIETNGGPRAVGEINIADVCEDEICAYALADLSDELHRNGRNDELAEWLDEQLISNGRADFVNWFAAARESPDDEVPLSGFVPPAIQRFEIPSAVMISGDDAYDLIHAGEEDEDE